MSAKVICPTATPVLNNALRNWTGARVTVEHVQDGVFCAELRVKGEVLVASGACMTADSSLRSLNWKLSHCSHIPKIGGAA